MTIPLSFCLFKKETDLHCCGRGLPCSGRQRAYLINRGGRENGMSNEVKGNESSLQRLLEIFLAAIEIVPLLAKTRGE